MKLWRRHGEHWTWSWVSPFIQDLVSLCNFHNYDNLRHFAKKLDPRREGGDQRVSPSSSSYFIDPNCCWSFCHIMLLLCFRWSQWSICCLLPTPETSQLWGGTPALWPPVWFEDDVALHRLLTVSLCRFALSSMDMEQRDYDSRTALHVAAAEGETTRERFCFHEFMQCLCSLSWRSFVFQDTLRWFASCWRPAKSTRFPKTGNETRL